MADKRDLVERVAMALLVAERDDYCDPNGDQSEGYHERASAAITETLEAMMDDPWLKPIMSKWQHSDEIVAYIQDFASAHNITLKKEGNE